ncbi:MAG TPA: hypothetical protein VFM21_03700 [Terriglobia bacterium]|nr:hypothetical protein [Terriglobia bacterium]
MRPDDINGVETEPASTELSKRAARRLIQRAFVLTGRERQIRQHIRETHVAMQWVLEDEGLEWTVLLDRGKMIFDRRPVKKPDVILKWAEARAFFESARTGRDEPDAFTIEGSPELRRVAELVWRGFRAALGNVLSFPYDEDGVRLA